MFLILSVWIVVFKKLAFLFFDSTRTNWLSGLMIASGMPGQPPPLPTSTTVPSEMSCAMLKESSRRLVTASNGSMIAVRLSVWFCCNNKLVYVINRLMLCCSVLSPICCSPCFNKSLVWPLGLALVLCFALAFFCSIY